MTLGLEFLASTWLRGDTLGDSTGRKVFAHIGLEMLRFADILCREEFFLKDIYGVDMVWLD